MGYLDVPGFGPARPGQRGPVLIENDDEDLGLHRPVHPEQAGIVILAILHGMSNALLKLLIASEQAQDKRHYVDEIVATSCASAEAIERVLGTSTPILVRPDAAAVQAWLSAPRENEA